jgi:hypothetical protein
MYADIGLMDESVGLGFGAALIVKLRDPDVPPPGAGFTTAILPVPTLDRSDAGISAVSDEALS